MKCIRFDNPQPAERKRRRPLGIVAAALGLLVWAAVCALPAFGLINPRFTPADLVRSSSQILLLNLSEPKDGVVAADIVETLRGAAPAEKKIALHLDTAGDLSEEGVKAAFNGRPAAAAVLLLAAPETVDLSKDPLGVVQIGTQWFTVLKKGEQLVLDADRREMGSVWAGSARMLAAAARYVQQDPAAAFPVKSSLAWGGDLDLGALPGGANRCIAADLGEPAGLCVIVLSDGGDRVYQAATQGGKPADVTQKLKLTTASKLAALGDFDGDGRTGLASWNGTALTIASRAADGTFGAPRAVVPNLPACLSLDAIDAGAKPGAGLVVGTPEQPLLVLPDGAGGFAVQPLAGGAGKDLSKEMGAGGLCVAADFDRDGRCDVIQVFPKGVLTYAGEAPGRFKDPVKTALSLPEKPCVALCGDFDTDGWLDVVVAGADGLALLSHDEARQWQDQTQITGELAYHGNSNRPKIIGAALSDINSDGRQGVALFYADRKPMSFFSRGFACFGWAHELDSAGASNADAPAETTAPKPPLKGLQALEAGQTAGAMLDLNGDGIPDMLAVDRDREVWLLLGENQDGARPRTLALALAPQFAGPLLVTVRDRDRGVGMYVVRAGVPAFIARSQAGPVTLEWMDAGGKLVTRKVVVLRDLTRLTIP